MDLLDQLLPDNMRIRKSFTFIEVVVVMGIVSLLFALTAPDLFKLQDRNALQNTTIELTSLLRQQQFNAMNTGVTSGIHFDSDKYILYRGDEYVVGLSENTEYPLPYPLSFSSIPVENGNIRFASGSGEFVNFSPNANTITLTDTVHLNERTVTVNALGIPSIEQ